MGRTWILDTSTKGTGAQMVPLERTVKRSSAKQPVFIPRAPDRPREAATPAPAPRAPRRFRIVDVMSRQELAAGAGLREAVDVLAAVDRLLDVRVWIWDDTRRDWRLLSLGEQKSLWEFARTATAAAANQAGDRGPVTA